jgi:hypothetical protein
MAQEVDTVRQKRDFRPTGLRFGTDLIPLVRNTYDDHFKGWELNADVDFYRYYFSVDYGYWARSYPTDSSDYENSGTYMRVGVDVNFLKNDPDRNMVFIGVRYGFGTFDEHLSVIGENPYWGSLSGDYTNENVRAQWLELVTGLRVRMWKMIWMGYTVRLKFGLSTSDTPEMLPHDVPGFGRADVDSYWGFNYQIFVRLPVRKAPPSPAKK